MPRVLLVDDDIAEISAVKRVLARAGHQALLATNASDALGTIGRAPPAALLVASSCEGGEALRRIAEDAVGGSLPLLVLGETGEAPPGADQIARPVDPSQLADRLAAALGGAALPPAHAAPVQPVARIAVDRRSAADALRARAEELRRGAVTSGLPDAPPRPAPAPPPRAPAPPPPPPLALEPEHEAPASSDLATDLLDALAAQPELAPEPSDHETPVTFGDDGMGLGLGLGLGGDVPEAGDGHETPVTFGEEPATAETPVTFGEEPAAAETAVTFAEPPADLESGLGAGPGLELEAGAEPPGPTAYALEAGETPAYEPPADEVPAYEPPGGEPPAYDLAGDGPLAYEQPPADAPGADAEGEALDAHAEAEAALAELQAPAPAAHAADLDLAQDPGLEALLRRAEEAEARARQEADARRARQEAAARAAAEEEAQRAEEHRRRADEEARRAADAEERARSEREARETADRELQRLRHELEEARRAAEERARAVAEAARAEEEETRRRSEAEEEQLRAAIQSARAEMDALRKRGEEEARRRAKAEEQAARLAREAEQARTALEAEREAGEAEAARRAREAEAETARRAQEAEAEAVRRAEDAERRAREAEERAAEARRSAELAASVAPPPPLEMPVYVPPAAEPEPDPAQESARRRVAALRERERPAAPGRAAAPARAPSVADVLDAVPAAAAPPPAPEEPPRAPVRTPPPELRAGTLADLPAPRLLALVHRAKVSGRIDVDGAAARSLWLDGGRVVGATSSAPAERVEEVALRLGLVTRDQHRAVAASAAPLASRRAALLLLERGFIKPAELAPLVRRRTEEVVFGVFGEAGARFRWAAAEVPPDESTALERTALQLAVEGVRRRWLATEVDAILGGDATLLAPVATPPSAADLGLGPDERRVLALADGLRTLDEILAASPLDPLSTRQLLAALVLVSAVGVRTFQAGRPAAAASAAIDLARVRDKLEQVRRADYFTVLGVGRLCTPHEVRDAHDRLRAEFDPRRFQGVREEGLDARLEEILGVVEDARDVLADDFLRAEYLRGLGD